MKEPRLIVGIGELLWDMLPNGPRLGGAPANFSVMAGRLGNRSAILSRIGSDSLGRQALERLETMPVETGWIETDSIYETGQVTVTFAGSEPHYRIHQPAAWDYLEATEEWLRLARQADAFCFGTLAQRGEQSRRTIQTLAAETSAACIRVFDANLRAPFYNADVLQESLELATVVKMNSTEAPLVLDLLDLAEETDKAAFPALSTEHLRAIAERLLRQYPSLQMVTITRGCSGSLLATREEWNEHPGFPVVMADCIGAGDAFTAALTHYLLRGADLATLNEAGNRWGGWMASQSGAMPALPETVREAIAAEIERTAL